LRERALLQEYQQAASAFQLLTETRFRLLALLPIGAGVGAVAVDTRVDDDAVKVAIGLFGLAVTIALLTYNARNDQLYDTLVARLAHIERELTLPDGAFANRPGVWLRLFGVKVEHGWPVVTVYLACVAAWIFVSLSFIGAPAALVAAVIVVLVGPTVGVGGCVLEAGREISARHLRADEVLRKTR
jgi:hypothetical protein